MNIDAEIQRLSAMRTQAWKDGDPEGIAPQLGNEIAALYARRREEAARARYGDAQTIQKRARIESELERLMSD